MANTRHDYREQAAPKYGKPGVSYPYGDPAYPRIVEQRTVRKGTPALAPLTPHREQKLYPGAVLVEQTADPGDDTDKNVTEVYETLPGPVFADTMADPELDIPVMTTTQRRKATDLFACGLIGPVPFSISGATAAGQTVVTTSMPHDFFAGEYLVLSGTSHTTPSLNGTFLVLGVTDNTVTLDKEIDAVSGAVGGTVKRYSHATVTRRKTENVNVVEMVTTRAVVADIATYNQSTIAYRPYPFPDALLGITHYLDLASSSGPSSYSFSESGGIGIRTLSGYRGDCKATRLRVFSMGPVTTLPTNPATGFPYSPTVILLASGIVTIRGLAFSFSVSSAGITESTSFSFKGQSIPPTLWAQSAGAFTGFPGTIHESGTGNSHADLDLVPSIVKDVGSSVRTGFVQGDIITSIDPPEKLRDIGVYMTTIWLIECPYTTGTEPI